MNKWIIFIFFSLIFSQQEFSYNNMVKMWMDYKFDDQQEFRYQVNEYLSYLDLSQNIDEVKLNFWMVRSYYSDGKIEEAIEFYESQVKEKFIGHEPFKEEMKNCNNSKCLCTNMRKYDSQHIDNLDIMKSEVLDENFANLWIVVGRDSKTIHTPDLKTDDFIGDDNITSSIHQPSSPVNINYGSEDNPKSVRFAVLPRPFDESKLSIENSLDEQLHYRAKWKRINMIRNKYWDNENSQIRKIDDLSKLDFIDILTVNNEEVLKKDGKLQYAKLLKINDNSKIQKSFFPILDNKEKDDITNFHRLYVFNEKDKYNRYSFKISPKEFDLSSFGVFDESDSKSGSDYFVFVKWQTGGEPKDNWFLSDFIDDEQFTLAIPSEYSRNYNISINNKAYETIKEDDFNNGLKINLNPDNTNLLKYDDWFTDDSFKNSPDLINIDGQELIDADLLEVRMNDGEILRIKIDKEIDDIEQSDNKKSTRLIWYTVIASFIVGLIN